LKFARSILSLVFLFLLIYGCAQIGRIEGGPKDVDPPEFVNGKPENYSINFDDDEIRILFNEYVKLKNASQQIIFSPPISPKPIITPMGLASKEVKIELEKDSLRPNTTYTINFGLSIEDNNEGNALPFFKYVFSTGDYIDSLQLSGVVKDIFNKENPEFISVMLYEKDRNYKDSAVYKTIPTYISYAKDSSNQFFLENMRKGTYKLVALEDRNNNYKFNQGSEKIGFVEGFIELPTEQRYAINLFETSRDFSPKRPKQVSKNHLIFGYEGVLDTSRFEIKLLSKAPDTLKSVITKNRETDTLNYYFYPYFESDSLLFSFKHKNTVDTLTVRIKELYPDSLNIEIKPNGNIEINESVYIRPNLPIVAFNTEKIELIDADSLAIPFKATLDSFNNQLGLSFTKTENTKYNLSLFPEAITDLFGHTNDTIKSRLSTKKRESYGTLQFTLNNVKRFPIIVQLVDDKGKVESSTVLTNTNKHTFEYINPGEYFIKVIYDDNNNGKWDPGDYLKQIQPEDVEFAPKLNNVRANWDVVQTFSLP
jgi:hypothetical protein